MNEKQIQERERLAHLQQARERFREQIRFALMQAGKGAEKAEAGEAATAAGYLSAVQDLLSEALEQEAAAYEQYGGKRGAK